MTTQDQASLDAHGKSIDALHAQLAASPNVDKNKLQVAVEKYKHAHAQFVEDAKGCMG